jgi:hypothetical protein
LPEFPGLLVAATHNHQREGRSFIEELKRNSEIQNPPFFALARWGRRV